MEKNKIFTSVLCLNLETRPRGRPRNRLKIKGREGGRIVGGEW
jgi:hypothetical protein